MLVNLMLVNLAWPQSATEHCRGGSYNLCYQMKEQGKAIAVFARLGGFFVARKQVYNGSCSFYYQTVLYVIMSVTRGTLCWISPVSGLNL